MQQETEVLPKTEELNGNVTPISSTTSSPNKQTSANNIKDDDCTSNKSGRSTASSWVTLDTENDDEDSLKKKEIHLQNLGLVTHKAAEKRRLEVIQSSQAAVEASKTQPQQSKRNCKSANAAATHHQQEYTGTLKTVIKLNRNTGAAGAGGCGSAAATSTGNTGVRKSHGSSAQTAAAAAASAAATAKDQQQRRQSLKMTFQKGRGRSHANANSERSHHDRENHNEDNYYTIQNEVIYCKIHCNYTGIKYFLLFSYFLCRLKVGLIDPLKILLTQLPPLVILD